MSWYDIPFLVCAFLSFRILESTSSTDRRVVSFPFSLTGDQLTKMKASG